MTEMLAHRETIVYHRERRASETADVSLYINFLLRAKTNNGILPD